MRLIEESLSAAQLWLKTQGKRSHTFVPDGFERLLPRIDQREVFVAPCQFYPRAVEGLDDCGIEM